MKTIKFFLPLVAVALVLIATATEKPKMNVIPLEDDKALIAIASEKPAYFELSIESQNGDLLYFKESSTEITDLRQVIDYSNLENGLYKLKLKVNDTFVSRDIEVNNSGLIIAEAKMKYAPYFTYSGDVLKLSFLNFEKESINLKIYSKGNLIFENKLGKGFVLNAGYNLSNLEKGNYTVELSSLSNDFSYNIEK